MLVTPGSSGLSSPEPSSIGTNLISATANPALADANAKKSSSLLFNAETSKVCGACGLQIPSNSTKCPYCGNL